MNRRALLATVGGLGATALAGCLADGGGAGPDTATATDVTPATGTDATPTTPTVVEKSFELVDAGDRRDEASVSFGPPVTVTGSIPGNNGCYTAVLDRVRYDHPTLEVVVRSKEDKPATDTGCTMAIVHIGYEATVRFEGGGPGEVVVKHRRNDSVETVARASAEE